MENEIKLLAMIQDMSEKFDTIIDLLKRIESNTSSTDSHCGDIYYVKSELEDLNTKASKILKKMD